VVTNQAYCASARQLLWVLFFWRSLVYILPKPLMSCQLTALGKYLMLLSNILQSSIKLNCNTFARK